jgi:hypothetical protein
MPAFTPGDYPTAADSHKWKRERKDDRKLFEQRLNNNWTSFQKSEEPCRHSDGKVVGQVMGSNWKSDDGKVIGAGTGEGDGKVIGRAMGRDWLEQ